MFERYTEKARRVIFFARYEASQFGSPYIETEHILLGILREDKATAARILPGTTESIYQQVEQQALKNPKTPANVDLPLSNECKRVLAYAAEEGERLNHRHIGSEHLLLGLLREKKSFAAQMLEERGVKLEQARKVVGDGERAVDRGLGPDETVTIHGVELTADYVEECVKECRQFFWQKRAFLPSDVAIRRQDRTISFDLTLAADSANFELATAGWKKDPCKICSWTLHESDVPLRGVGYTNGRDWLCSECYEGFVLVTSKG